MRQFDWTVPLREPYCGRATPHGVALLYEEWLAYSFNLSTTDFNDGDDMKGVAPHRVLEMERDTARAELRSTRLELQELRRQAQAAVQSLAKQCQQKDVFVAALLHSQGGEVRVPDDSFRVIGAGKYLLDEGRDNDSKCVVLTLREAPAEEPGQPGDASNPVQQEPAAAEQPAPPSLIEVVSR